MSTIKSSSEHLTLNADGASKDIKFQANGVEKASISSAGAFTSTTIDATALTGALPAIDGSSLTGMSSGLYTSVAIIADHKAFNTMGGTFTSGAWRTRDLNTEVSDADGIVSINSNQFTLGAGTYTIQFFAPARNCYSHTARLYNTTDSIAYYSISNYYEASDSSQVYGEAIVTIAGSKTFEIQHRCATTKSSDGFGRGNEVEGSSVFTTVRIIKHS
jgi:hypothetical protein